MNKGHVTFGNSPQWPTFLKESKIMIWDECTMAHMHIGSTWLDIERSAAQWLEMLWRRNDFIAWRFSPNNASYSKIDWCRWNKRLPQICGAMWWNFNWQQTRELHCWTIYLLKSYPNNCWLSVIVIFLSTNRADWYHFLWIFAISFHRKMSHQQSVPEHHS